MGLRMDVLTDEELQYLVKLDIGMFIEPIKQKQKQYQQYTSLSFFEL